MFYRIFSAAVGLRTGAGKIWRKHANSKLSILVLPSVITFHDEKFLILFLSGLSTEHVDSDDSDNEHEIEWSHDLYYSSEEEGVLDLADSCESS